jgi:hypothetical protein
MGVKGMLLLGCLPLWRSEGVTLIIYLKDLEYLDEHRFLMKPKFCNLAKSV